MFGLGRRKDAGLESLATVIQGTVDREGHLRGTVRGRAVEAWFERLDPTPLTGITSFNPVYANVLRLRLEGRGSTPWYVRSEARLGIGGGHVYEFVREAAPAALRRFSPFPDLMPVQDRAVEARLQDAGLMEAIARVSPPSRLWLPRVRFTPDPRAAMMERMRGVPIPAGVSGTPSATAKVGLEIDLERDDGGGPTPERFAEILEGLIAVAELNEAVSPGS
ncbi:hypothetical protein SCMU_03600 [Sinomonas cyclohexanicum]|uniref:Uncharacterized protein n=1 Tax=Sinomonas cyclohexanicum TaxID=322009 RepID=A0ABM7PQR2_SINCY|nr:hypothetical protein [Corynebacterium cyclohexanicum]BCT74518.1 hypothetical protein SCMU_03600 [Corynebacterium cyclohexanicum]